jgi:acetyltransferase-like isoleucine patch superfamily enzyme
MAIRPAAVELLVSTLAMTARSSLRRLSQIAQHSRGLLDHPERIPWELRYRYGGRLASELRRVTIQATHRHCTVEFGEDNHIGPLFSLYMPHSGTFRTGRGVEFRRGFHCEISGNGRVEIGNDCVFTSYPLIQCSTVIEIGDGTGIGQSCIILDGKHAYRDITKHWDDQGYIFNEVHIGRNCMVMAKTTIQASIGDGCVIGANSVVIRPIPAYCLAVGAPARVIDYFGPPEQRPPELGP